MASVFASDHIQLRSPLPISECVTRLQAKVDRFRVFGSKPAVGWVSHTDLQLRKRIGYNNSFQSVLNASLRAVSDGTEISGVFAVHPFVQIFMLIWFGFVALLGSVFVIAFVGHALLVDGEPRALIVVPFPLLMLAGGYGVVRLGRYLARDEARFLTNLLIETLSAKPLKLEATSPYDER